MLSESVLLLLARATVVLVAAPGLAAMLSESVPPRPAGAPVALVPPLGRARARPRAPAGTRHVVWLAALGALLLVPALAAWGPLRIAVLPAPPAAVGALVSAS